VDHGVERSAQLWRRHHVDLARQGDRGDPAQRDGADFLRELGQKLTPGTAAVIALVPKVMPETMLPEVSRYGGDVLQTSLNDEGERNLRRALHSGLEPSGQTG